MRCRTNRRRHRLDPRPTGYRSPARPSASRSVIQSAHTLLFRAVRAAEEFALRLRAVANYLATAVGASRRERVNGTFKRIEPVRFSSNGDLHRLVVFISAGFALRHIRREVAARMRRRGGSRTYLRRFAANASNQVCSCKLFVRSKALGCRSLSKRSFLPRPCPGVDFAFVRGSVLTASTPSGRADERLRASDEAPACGLARTFTRTRSRIR